MYLLLSDDIDDIIYKVLCLKSEFIVHDEAYPGRFCTYLDFCLPEFFPVVVLFNTFFELTEKYVDII